MDTCQICLDSGTEPLQDIKLCQCKYKCHNSCWIDYVHSQPRLKCLMCRKPIQTPPITKSSLTQPRVVIPTAPPLRPYTPPQEVGVSYQQFQEIPQHDVIIPISSQTHPIQQTQSFTQLKLTQILQVLCVLAVVAIIIIIIAVVL